MAKKLTSKEISAALRTEASMRVMPHLFRHDKPHITAQYRLPTLDLIRDLLLLGIKRDIDMLKAQYGAELVEDIDPLNPTGIDRHIIPAQAQWLIRAVQSASEEDRFHDDPADTDPDEDEVF